MSRLFAFAIGCLVLQTTLPALAADLKLGDLGYNNGINSNPHNLSSNATTPADNPRASEITEICVFCHTPHGASAQAPLWNRTDPISMGSFPLFNSVSVAIDDPLTTPESKYVLNGTNVGGETIEYPNGATKLCLSCHDGVTSIGTLADNRVIAMTQDTITDPTMFWDPVNNLGMDFSKSHPVSFVYNAQVVADILDSGKADYKVFSPTTRIRLDGQQRMQCTTCHEPHFDTKATGHTYPFWRNAEVVPSGTDIDDYDATCNECHTPSYITLHNI